MAILNKIFPAVLALTLTGCYKDFDPKIPSQEVLCINSLITAGEPIEVQLSHTWAYNAGINPDRTVDDATIVITVNGLPAPEGYIAAEGDSIAIRAVSTRYGEAAASVVVPHAPLSPELKYSLSRTDCGVDDYGDFTLSYAWMDVRARITIFDIPGRKNYYELKWSTFPESTQPEDPDVSELHNVNFYGGEFRYESEPIFGEHIGAFESAMGNNDTFGYTFFTDRQFDGADYTLRLDFSRAHAEIIAYNENPPADTAIGYDFTIYAVSESYYNWRVYLWNADEGISGEMGDIGLADPMWAYSNVSTGAGVVAARAQTTIRLILPFP